MRLPLRTTRRGRKTTRVTSHAQTPQAKRAELPLKILIADDEEHIRSVLSHVVKEWHHIPDVVDNLAEARNLCSERKFDVLFIDAGLGGPADLADAISLARSSNPAVRAFLISDNPSALPRDLKDISEEALDRSFSVEQIHNLLSG